MKKIIGIMAVTSLLFACQDKPQITHAAQTKKTTNTANIIKQPIAKQKCVSNTIKKSPPVKDKSKIEAMLLASGKISLDMTIQARETAVNNYIRKKSAAFKDCKEKR